MAKKTALPRPKAHWAPATRAEAKTCVDALFNRLRDDLYELERRMADSRRNKKRGKGIFWNPQRLIGNDGKYLDIFKLTEGVFWSPYIGLEVNTTACHKQVVKMIKAYYDGVKIQ